MKPGDAVQTVLAGMSAEKRAELLRLNPALRALDTQRVAACPPSERAALAASTKARADHAAQGAAAQASGGEWEAAVYAALRDLSPSEELLDLGVCPVDFAVAWWEHTSHGSKMIDGAWRPVKHALCDVVGATGDGRALVIEVKRAREGAVDLRPDSTARARVKPHQARQLQATADVGGVALLVVEVRGVVAVIPWRELRGVETVNVEVARRFEARRGLTEALRSAIEGSER